MKHKPDVGGRPELIGRRNLLAMLMMTAALRPSAAIAEPQPGRVYRIVLAGLFSTAPVIADSPRDYWRAFFEGLRRRGYVEGQNLTIDRRTLGKGKTFAAQAQAIAATKPDAAWGAGQMTVALARASSTLQVVGTMSDPVALKTVESLARPGGNITGVTIDPGIAIVGKRIELLRAVAPQISRIAYLSAAGTLTGETYVDFINRSLRARMGVEATLVTVDPPRDEPAYRKAFAVIAEQHFDGLVVSPEAEFVATAGTITALATEARLPAIYALRDYATGGLITYAVDYVELWRRMGDDLGAILDGARAGDIPVYQPSKFELTINLKAAKALGLNVPTMLLATADDVIE